MFVFGIYYAPYVYMFTSSALRNMDPSLEEAAEISGASAFATLFSVTFPLIMPAIVSGMLLSFIVMLGIYGIPAVLGAPANINVLTTYIFKLTNWSPPLYNTAAAVAIILMVVTGALVFLQQKVLSGRSYTTVAGKAFRPRSLDLGPWRWFTFALGVVYLLVVVILPLLALIVAAFRKFMFIRDVASLFDMRAIFADAFQQHLRQSADHAIRSTTRSRSASSPPSSAARSPLRSATPSTAPVCRAGAAIDLISTVPVAIPGLVIGVAYLWAWIGIPGGLYGTIWILALAFIARFMPDTVKSLSTSFLQIHRELEEAAWVCGKGMLGTIAHHRAAAGAAGRDRLDDAAVRAGDPRTRLVAVSLHQQHHGDVGAAARLLRRRQYRQDRRLQPGADGAARRAHRRRQLAVARRGAGRRRATNQIIKETKGRMC